MMNSQCVRRERYDHPCFYGSARGRWGRVHLPVAPDCNIQCNFCNRLYDCANESRPGVTGVMLEPGDVGPYLDTLLKKGPDISVIGIAGPGDPLAAPERTLEALGVVKTRYPGFLLCLSTNGLNLPDHVDALVCLGVTHVTVTMNAVDPAVGSKIYRRVRMGSRTYGGDEGAALLLSRQRAGIRALKERDVTVKVNTVVVPGVNSGHVEDIAAEASAMGADIMNCIPMVPVAGTPFGGLKEPSGEEMERIRAIAARYIPQMYHCARCRADAAGLLGESHEKDECVSIARRPGASGCDRPIVSL